MTEMIESWQEVYTKEYIENMNKSYPLGIGKVENVVEPILFLLSDKAKWITGSELMGEGVYTTLTKNYKKLDLLQ